MTVLRSVTQVSYLSGDPATRSITFGWRGKSFVLDLTAAEERQFVRVMQPYVRAARQVSVRELGLSDDQARRRAYLRALRDFAAREGYALPVPYRPSRELEDAYRAETRGGEHPLRAAGTTCASTPSPESCDG